MMMTIPPQQEYQEHYVPGSDTWSIGLSPWILADGNHWNGTFFGFYRNQSAPFALEIIPRSIIPASSRDKQVVHQGDDIYTLTGEVVFVWEHGWILDFGLQAYVYYRSKPSYLPEHCSFVAVETYLTVDHFAYFLFLYKVSSIPPLIYQWHIQRVIRKIYPLVRQTRADKPDFFIPDLTLSRYVEQENTQYYNNFAVADKTIFPNAEKMSDSFILECQLQSLERSYPTAKSED